MQTLESSKLINGVDVQALQRLIETVRRDPAAGQTHWNVTTNWVDGAVSQTRITGYEIGGRRIAREFMLTVDEPHELCGTNTHPNPQEYLLAALNACMTVGYVAVASLMGIELTRVQIETDGPIDLRGFLGIDPNVKPGYDSLRYKVRIGGNGTPEQFQKIHEIVMATSPNRFNLASAIAMNAELIVQ